MKVLIVSSNTLPASPSGPAYLAGPVRQAGHQVEIFECLLADFVEQELGAHLDRFQPDVVAISIRLVQGDVQDPDAPYGTRHIDLRPAVGQLVEVVRAHTVARIVLGGPGFNYYAQDWLDYLQVDDGIRGEGEESFPLFLQRLEQGGELDSIPGYVNRQGGGRRAVEPARVADLNCTSLPAYDLFALDQYAARGIHPAIFTKRGCALRCTYCPYARLEGNRYRLKDPERVLAEVRHVLAHTPNRRILFCDNSFNIPTRHARDLCQAFCKAGYDFQWGTGDLKPIGVTDEFCRLMQASGCFAVNLAVESASDAMLRRMQRGYTVRQVRQALEALSRSDLPFSASLMLGAPGETPETIAETLSVLDDFAIPGGVWVTIGVYLWTDYQDIVRAGRQTGALKADQDLFAGAVYFSPDLPELTGLVEAIRHRPGYTVQVNQPN